MHYQDSAYLMGAKAFLEGIPKAENPFPHTSTVYLHWSLGWCAARRYHNRYANRSNQCSHNSL